MNINNHFPSKWWKASDINGQEMIVAMSHVQLEDVGDDQKMVLYFQGHQKGLVLNKTNATNISTIYGPETEGWAGKQICLFPTMVDFQGRSVDALRVKPVAPIQMQPSQQAVQQAQAPLQQDGRPTPPDDTYVPVDA